MSSNSRQFSRCNTAIAVYAVVVLFVRLSQAGIVPNRLNTGWRKQLHTIPQGL